MRKHVEDCAHPTFVEEVEDSQSYYFIELKIDLSRQWVEEKKIVVISIDGSHLSRKTHEDMVLPTNLTRK